MLYWATHNAPSSILPFIMNAVVPFKCSHKHTADKNLIKCRLKPNRKTHSLIIFYHIPWSYFFFSSFALSTCSSLGYRTLSLSVSVCLSLFAKLQKWKHLVHLAFGALRLNGNARRGTVSGLISDGKEK